jgi:hypothetical protein
MDGALFGCSELLTFVVIMIDHACQYLRFNDQHRNKPKGVSLLSDPPARRVVANPVPAFLAVPIAGIIIRKLFKKIHDRHTKPFGDG